jgi:hypothetical protein
MKRYSGQVYIRHVELRRYLLKNGSNSAVPFEMFSAERSKHGVQRSAITLAVLDFKESIRSG